MNLLNKKIAIIGLGYVGLPLAVEFGKSFDVVGFDISDERISDLKDGHDANLEVDAREFDEAKRLDFTSEETTLGDCSVFIVTVPTPIDPSNRPDLSPLKMATEIVARNMKTGSVVIYESTVYPGCTSNFCCPILEKNSGLTHNRDFFTGYSPERINPGDKTHRLTSIVKVTSGSTDEVADAIDQLYATVIPAGTFKAASIKVAEAAKVIENTQRDLNIAFVNELSLIFNKLDIDTIDVLKAAETKWNFLRFSPGLVGGHCIGVDPFYLTHCAEEIGYHPEVILAGRRINDGMASYLVNRVVRMMMKKGISVVGSKILVLGLTFKENCPDLRNSKVIDVVKELIECNAEVDVHDPFADRDYSRDKHGISLLNELPSQGDYDAVLLCVGHDEYKQIGAKQIRAYAKPGSFFFDVKSVFDKSESDGRL